eukprot:TRINITY_DN16581_c0_g1_i1.p1 TRINITY_DN16581_c0_g1~~TRINITY_DN16581_c0_g1_i1.p1  ORF type:complete len:109 (-),score=15.20 TRINITY_DN16581_c0_g1_i1:203-529(-)
MDFSASKRKLSGSELSTSSKRSKKDSEDSLPVAFDRYVTVANPHTGQSIEGYDEINAKLREAVHEAKRTREAQSLGSGECRLTLDKETRENKYESINGFLKSIQFNAQ